MLKSFKKIASCVLLAALTSTVFAGCGGTRVGGNNSKGKATITVMQQNNAQYDYFAEIGKDFTKSHPNVTIKYIGVPYDNFDSKLQTMIASGTQPDITTHVQLMGFMDYYHKNLLTDLTPYIEKYKYDYKSDKIPDSVWKMANVGGKQYGIPLNTFTTVMLYNKSIFDKAGIAYPTSDYSDTTWTFDKMVEIAKKLTSGTGNNKIYGLYWTWNGQGEMLDPDYFGQSLFPEGSVKNGKATTNKISDPSVYSVYQRLADLVYKDQVSPSPSYVSALAGSNASDPFLSGRIAMEVEASWGLSGINDLPFKAGVAAVPVGGNQKVRSVVYTDPYFILKGSKNPDEAFQYLTFLANKENQEKMVEIAKGGCPPANTDALNKYYSFFNSIDSKDMQNAIGGSFDYSKEDLEHEIVGSGQIHDLLANELQPVEAGKKEAKDVCVPLESKLNSTLKDIK